MLSVAYDRMGLLEPIKFTSNIGVMYSEHSRLLKYRSFEQDFIILWTMDIEIRREVKDDFQDVLGLIENAFEREDLSDHKEQYLVSRLRKSDALVPGLSLVATVNNTIVGYILLMQICFPFDDFFSIL